MKISTMLVNNVNLNCRLFADLTNVSHEEWLELRKKGIGGSEVAAILGASPWSSAVSVYMDKIGMGIPVEENEQMEWGTRLEEVIRQKFIEETGFWVIKPNMMLQHPTYDWGLANLDGLIFDPNDPEPGVLEIKTGSVMKKHEWLDDEVPLNYLLQIQYYMGITGLKWGYFARLLGGSCYGSIRVERNEELIQELFKRCDDFWLNYILKQVPPEVDGSESSDRALKTLYPKAEKVTIEIPDQMDVVTQYLQAEIVSEEADEKLNYLKQLLQSRLGTAEVGICGKHTITWSNTKGRVTVDGNLLKSKYPLIYKEVAKEGKPSRRFSVKGEE